jgi:hypothetical protein
MNWRRLTKEEKKNLTPGMHLGIGTSWGISAGTWPTLLMYDTHVNLWGGDTVESKTDFADLYVLEDEFKNQQPENFRLDEK